VTGHVFSSLEHRDEAKDDGSWGSELKLFENPGCGSVMSNKKWHSLSRNSLTSVYQREVMPKESGNSSCKLRQNEMQAQKGRVRRFKDWLFYLQKFHARGLTVDFLMTIICNHLNISKKCWEILRKWMQNLFYTFVHTMACTKRKKRRRKIESIKKRCSWWEQLQNNQCVCVFCSLCAYVVASACCLFLLLEEKKYTPYSKMAATLLFFCLQGY